METTLTIKNGLDLILAVGPGDGVLVPIRPEERALCRQALEAALKLLADTTVCCSNLATGDVEIDGFSKSEITTEAGSFTVITAERYWD